MTVEEIVTRVRSAIDELTANDSDFLGASSDEQNLTDVIKDKIPYALTFVLENSPEEKLDGDILDSLTQAETSGVAIAAGQPVKVKLPTDVLRVVSARLSSWSQSPIPVTERSQEYLMQQDEYARGSWDRPVSAIAYKNKDRYIELYSAKESNDEVEISVVRRPGTVNVSNLSANIGVPVRLEGAFIYQVAGLSMVAFREDIAASLFSIAQQHLTGTALSRNNERE